MTLVVLAISVAYVVMAVVLLCMGLTSRFAWWLKGVVIVVTSIFFVESFFATKGLLGWPGSGRLPHRFQLLWTRVVEPDRKVNDAGAIYLWVEELDDNNVPSGTPRSFQLPYSVPLADKTNKARDEIMSGNPQEGTASDLESDDQKTEAKLDQMNGPNHPEAGLSNIEIEMLRQADAVEFKPLSGDTAAAEELTPPAVGEGAGGRRQVAVAPGSAPNMHKPDPSQFQFIGRPLPRKEDARLITGTGRFSDDFSAPGQCHAAMVRSPHPHARIRGIDFARAKKMPGVLGVYGGADCIADRLKPIGHDPLPKTRDDMKLHAPGGGAVFIGPHMLLPADRARHAGEPVAMVVAETLAQALDAAEAVEVDYEPLPFVLHSEDAMADGAPPVWDEVPSNVLIDTRFGDQVATDRAFVVADHVVAMGFHIERVTGVPLEPRSALAEYDHADGRYTLFAGSGGAVRQKNELAAVLGIAPERLRVLAYDVGGNFGTRNRVFVEFGLVLWAAGKLHRPVKFTATRSECFLSDYQGRDLVTKVELAIRRDGRFLAMRATNISNVGARCVSLSPLSKGAGLITGCYDIPAASLRAVAVYTNTTPTNAYRSSGRPEVTFAIERLLDTAAAELGIDRVALRRKNLVRPDRMPYRNAVGMTYDSGRYEENMDQAMAIADWKGFPARRREAKRRGRLAGLGLANYVESSIGAPKEQAQIRVRPEGRVDVVIGTQPSGQGHETSFAQVVSDLIGVPVDKVNVIFGDTDVVRIGGGSHSGRSMRHAATVFSMSAAQLIDKGRRIAAVALATAPDRIAFADGRFVARETNRTFDMFELAAEVARLERSGDLAKDLAGGLSVVTDNEMHDPVFPNGTAICEVEIDPDTGEIAITRYASVDDVGRCINPLIVDGQTHGAIVQGVGQAMWELIRLDPDSGQLLSGSLMDYGMPRADVVPSFTTRIAEVLSPTNPLGIKAGGEGGTTAALAVVVSAIVDALREFGVRDVAMPATPDRIWRLIRDARAAGGGV